MRPKPRSSTKKFSAKRRKDHKERTFRQAKAKREGKLERVINETLIPQSAQ
jgi:hypothetical protein